VKRVAQLLGNAPAAVPLAMDTISDGLRSINPIAIGITPKRFANIRCDFVAAVKASGLASTLRRRRHAVPRSRLLPAATIKSVAILAGVTIVKMPQTFPATFAGFFRHKTIGAMGESLVLDGSRCFSGEQAHADTSENEDRSLHGILPFAAQAHTR
jgi:hypothetical protein